MTSDLIEIKKQTGLKQLYITGISLGGGLSVISFIDINQAKIFESVKVITFGAPRVGNKDWANHFDETTSRSSKRYNIFEDPVVPMPKCLTLLCNYQHTGI